MSDASRPEFDAFEESALRSAGVAARARGTRRVLPQLLLLALSLGVALLAAEAVLRVVVGSPPRWRYPQERYAADPALGHRLVPGQLAFTHGAPVVVNALGMRDHEVMAAIAPGTRRVLAIGDSQTFGNGLPLDTTWPKQLEQRLGSGTEVLNAGVPGTDTWQHERWLAELAGKLRFDFVVLGLYGNDVVPLPPKIGAEVALSNDGAHRVSYALRRSAFVTALWQAREPIRAWLLAPDPGALREQEIATGVEAADVEPGWRQVEASLRGMQRIVDDADARLLVLVIPRRDQVSARIAGDRFQQRVARVASRLGIEVVDPLPPLRAAYRDVGDRLFIPWDGHDSALANRVIADSLAGPVRGDLALAAGAAASADAR